MEINQEILEGLINIINFIYIDKEPHIIIICHNIHIEEILIKF